MEYDKEEQDFFDPRPFLIGEAVEIVYPIPNESDLYNPDKDDELVDHVMVRVINPNFNLLVPKNVKDRKKVIKQLNKKVKRTREDGTVIEEKKPLYVALKIIRMTRVDYQFNKLKTGLRSGADKQEDELARYSELIGSISEQGVFSNVKFSQIDEVFDAYVLSSANVNQEVALSFLKVNHKMFLDLFFSKYYQTEFLEMTYNQLKASVLFEPRYLAILNLKPTSIMDDEMTKYQRIKTPDLLQGILNISDKVVVWDVFHTIPTNLIDPEIEAINKLISKYRSVEEINMSDTAVTTVSYTAMGSESESQTVSEGYSRGESLQESYSDHSNLSSIQRNMSHTDSVKDLDRSFRTVTTWEKGSTNQFTDRQLNEFSEQQKWYEQESQAIKDIQRETIGVETGDRSSLMDQKIFTKENVSELRSSVLDSHEMTQRTSTGFELVDRSGFQTQDAVLQRVDTRGNVLHDNADIGSLVFEGSPNHQLDTTGISTVDGSQTVSNLDSRNLSDFTNIEASAGVRGAIGVGKGKDADSMGIYGYLEGYVEAGFSGGRGDLHNDLTSTDTILSSKQELLSGSFQDSIFEGTERMTSTGGQSIDTTRSAMTDQYSEAQRMSSLEAMRSEDLSYQQRIQSNVQEYYNLSESVSGREASGMEIDTQQLLNEHQTVEKINTMRQTFSGKEFSYSDSKSMGMSNQIGGVSSSGGSTSETFNFQESRSMASTMMAGVAAGSSFVKAVSYKLHNQDAVHTRMLLERLAFRYQKAKSMNMLLNQMIIAAESEYALNTALALIKGLYRNTSQDIMGIKQYIYEDKDAVNFFLSYLLTQTLLPAKIQLKDSAYDGYLHRFKYWIPIAMDEASIKLAPTVEEIGGIEVIRKNYPQFNQFDIKKHIPPELYIDIGNIYRHNRPTSKRFGFNYTDENHILITGGTGFGKTFLAIILIYQLYNARQKIIVFDPKGGKDYSRLLGMDLYDKGQKIIFFSYDRDQNGQAAFGPFVFNPLKPLTVFGQFLSTDQWINIFIECFIGGYGLRDRSKATLKDVLSRLYGLHKDEGDHPYGHTCQGDDWPHLSELLDLLYERYAYFRAPKTRDFTEAQHIFGVITRVKLLLHNQGDCFNTNKGLDLEYLFKSDTCPIIEFHGISDSLDRAFIMTLLVRACYEYYNNIMEMEDLQGEVLPKDFNAYLFVDEIHKLISAEENAAELQKNMINEFAVAGRALRGRLVPMAQSIFQLYETIPQVVINSYTHCHLRSQDGKDVAIIGEQYGWKDLSTEVTGKNADKLEFLRRFNMKEGQFFYKKNQPDVYQSMIKLRHVSEPYLIDIDGSDVAVAEPMSKMKRAAIANKLLKQELGDFKELQTELLGSIVQVLGEGQYQPAYLKHVREKKEKVEIQEFEQETSFKKDVLDVYNLMLRDRARHMFILTAISENNHTIEDINNSYHCKTIKKTSLINAIDNIMRNPPFNFNLIEENKENGEKSFRLTKFGHELIRKHKNLTKDDYYSEIDGSDLQQLVSEIEELDKPLPKNKKAILDMVATADHIIKEQELERGTRILEKALEDAIYINDPDLKKKIQEKLSLLTPTEGNIREYIISFFDDVTGVEIMHPTRDEIVTGISKQDMKKKLATLYKDTVEKETIEERRIEMIHNTTHAGKLLKYKFISQTYVVPKANKRDDFVLIMGIMDYNVSDEIITKISEIFNTFKYTKIYDPSSDVMKDLGLKLKSLKKTR